MKPKTLLLLLVLALAFFAFIYFFERELPSTTEREAQAKQVLPIDPDDVDQLEVSWGENPNQTVVLKREQAAKKEDAAKEGAAQEGTETPPAPAEWRLVSPLAARADAGVVSNLVRRLAELPKERTFDDFDAAQTGLAKPRVKVALEQRGERHELLFGSALPLGGAIFVGDGKKAYQVPGAADLVTELQKTPGDWRDKTLFHGERSHADQITLIEPDSKVVLKRHGEGENFDLVEPIRDAADRDLVSGLLTDLTSLQAATFLDPSTPFTPGGRSIEVALSSAATPFRIELGQALPENKVAAKVEGQLVSLDANRLVAAFERDAAGWRSPAWSSLQVFQVDHATFKAGGVVTEVKRVEGEWKRGEDKIDYSIASDALYPIVEVKAKEIVTRAEATARSFALAAPRLEIELEAEKTREKLTVYPASGELAAATAEGRDSVLLLPNDKILELEAKIATLRTAKPGEAAPPAPPPALGDDPAEGGSEE